MSVALSAPVVFARPHWVTCSLDLEGCERIEIVMALRPDERAGHAITSWPQDVRNKFEAAGRAALAEKKGRALRGVTTAYRNDGKGTRTLVMILHHAAAEPCDCEEPADRQPKEDTRDDPNAL